MATYFSGTSTGNKYEVGRDYKTGDGRVMTANSDGSFTQKGRVVGTTDAGRTIVDDRGRGNTSRGSYGNPDVEWYSDSRGGSTGANRGLAQGASLSDAGRSGKAGTSAQTADGTVRVQNPYTTSQGGNLRVSRVAAAAHGVGFGFGGGRIAPWSGLDDPEQHYMVAGFHMKASPRSSNMAMVEERQGDAEFLSPAWFASWGIAADDYVENIAIRAYGSEKTWDREHRASVQKEFVQNAFAGTLDWADEQIQKVRRDNAIAAAAKAQVEDAYAARDAILQQEALKAGDWTAIPQLNPR